ncbi:probable E3 ubiquitin-protein ligase RHB1A isoform X2 [Juglans regia]|uniref:RING-type E3 ubiquitin transferase n=1 Tax=Juglans regia TaxID=51240 RepID=A0A6P9EIY3_JUGRE|nr:probable E3 ubiquitin-protein ligase RHB1A isoform X2 [Juglans regia]
MVTLWDSSIVHGSCNKMIHYHLSYLLLSWRLLVECCRLQLSVVFSQCPPALEEHESLTSHAASTLIDGFLVDLGLDASTPDTYRPPPAPLPYDLILGCSRSTDSDSAGETIIGSSFGTLTTCEDLEESDCKAQANSLNVSPRKVEVPNLNELNISVAEEEDDCPICLEEYDSENPNTITRCEHHFHLSCILEWMERSNACPICDQEMTFDNTCT